MRTNIKRAILSIFTILTIFNSNYAQNNNSSIIGNWESVNGKNGRLQLLKIESDTTLYVQTDLAAEYSYSLIGNKMIAKLLNSTKTIIDTTDIVIKTDTVLSILKRNGTEEITTFIRLPGDSSKSTGIVGNYTWKYPNAHTAYSKFTSAGMWVFRLPIETTKGSYKLSSDTLTVFYTGLEPVKMKFWANDKLLILTDIKTGEENLYKKTDYFIKE